MGKPFRIFGKAIALVRDKGQAAWHPGGLGFRTNLTVAHVAADGTVLREQNLGSGVTTITGTSTFGQWSTTDGFFDLTWGVSTTANWQMATGTGTTAAASTDVNLEAGLGTTMTVATTAVSGATVTFTGTTSYAGSYAISEWGIFLVPSATAQTWVDTMMCFDRRTFGGINVISGQSLVWTYTLTLVAGG